MKTTRLAYLLLIVATLSGCVKQRSEATTAAMEMYKHFAHQNEELTVSLVAGYAVDSNRYDAVMLQAHDDSTFLALLDEVGVGIVRHLLSEELQDLTASIEWCERTPDSSWQSLAPSLDSAPQSNIAIMEVGKGSMQTVRKELLQGIEKYGLEYMSQLSSDTLLLNNEPISDSLHKDIASALEKSTSTMQLAKEHGSAGYYVSVQYSEQTVWLFFYNDEAERHQLEQHFHNRNN